MVATIMFVRDPFDIAPNASRHTTASWIALVVGVLFAVVGAVLLHRGLDAMNAATDAHRKSEELSRAQAAIDAAARARQSDPRSLEKMREQQKLQHMLRASWSGLFDALEVAAQQVQGHATVLALAPVKTQTQAAEVGLTALAISDQAMLDYVRALEQDPHVREVRLLSQQPALSGGMPVVRFQLLILWDAHGAASGLQPGSRFQAADGKGSPK
jgi:hypothetical protein